MRGPYVPRGRVTLLLEAFRDEPKRVWTTSEVARLIEVGHREVSAYVSYAIKAQVIHRVKRGRDVFYSLTPFRDAPKPPPAKPRKPAAWNPEGDPRIPQVVAGWRPPTMVPPRGVC